MGWIGYVVAFLIFCAGCYAAWRWIIAPILKKRGGI